MDKKFSKESYKAIISIGFIVIFVCLASYWFILETTKDIEEQEQQFLKEIATQNAMIVKRTLELNLDNLETITHIIESKDEFDVEYVVELLKLEAVRSTFKRMGYANLKGEAITTDDANFSVADRDYFKEAVRGQKSVSDRLEDKMQGGYINVYAVPLYHKGVIEGIVFATSETKSFADILETTLFGGMSYSYIIMKDGSPVIYDNKNNATMEFENFFDDIAINDDGDKKVEAIQRDMQSEKSGIVEYSIDGKNIVAAYGSVGINDWYVVSIVPKYIISQSANKIILRNSGIVSFTSVLFVCLIIYTFMQNRKNRQKLEKIAYYDELIGMPNFNAFQEKAQKILEKNPNKRYIFVKLDVENFKMINDRFGFEEGDLVLKNIAKSLSNIVREEGELFSRFAVDEFIIMLNEKTPEDIARLREEFVQGFYALSGSGALHYIKFPTGRYLTNKGEVSIDEIFEKVNYAHRQAKLLPEKTSITEFHYDDFQKAKDLRNSELEDRMEGALQNKEFKVYLQPKYELKNETIMGAEALVRWQEKSGNIIAPLEFIPLFERNGFVTKLDMYMFEEVCLIIRDWLEKGIEPVRVSVNFSRLHLVNSKFIENLVKIADKYEIPKKYLEIELTETVVFENINLLETMLEQIHKAGFVMSLDDFGTGYSSLSLLKNLPVDVIKMDRSFFDSNRNRTRTKTVVGCIIDLAQKLNIHTVAEGVEEVENIEFLREVGCEVVQGYYYAKPMPAEEFSKKLELIKS